MVTKRQKKEELEQHLFEQVELMKASCKSFDNGVLFEAKRIALGIRILLHDTGASHSLFNQLSIKNKIKYFDTSNPYDPKNLLTHSGLVFLKVSNDNIEFLPKLDKHTELKYRKFDSWWNGIIIKDNKGNKFTRKNIVLLITNKDGGAHIDPTLKDDYHNLTRENGIGWISNINDEEKGIDYIEHNSIRQIAYELIKSIEEYYQ